MKETMLKIRITKQEKLSFNDKCKQSKTTMSAAIRKFIKYYISHEPKQ